MTVEIILGAPFFNQKEAHEKFGIFLEFPDCLFSDFGKTKITISPFYQHETKYFRALAFDENKNFLADGVGSTKEESIQIMIGKLTLKLREQSKIEQAIKECYESFTLPESSNPRASILNLLASEKNL